MGSIILLSFLFGRKTHGIEVPFRIETSVECLWISSIKTTLTQESRIFSGFVKYPLTVEGVRGYY